MKQNGRMLGIFKLLDYQVIIHKTNKLRTAPLVSTKLMRSDAESSASSPLCYLRCFAGR